MFRTFDTNVMLMEQLRLVGPPENFSVSARKKNITAAIKHISDCVNNTPAICKKSYANAPLMDLYTDQPKLYKKLFFNDMSARANFIAFLESQSKKDA